MAGISDAIKFSPSPTPIIRGAFFLAAIILSGIDLCVTQKAYAPFSFLTALCTAFSRSFLSSNSCAIKCAATSVSV